ncbi:aldehyde dehydrogenase [Sclerotinia borealis F-4128]|uniref:DASH complex subunit DAD1 n=1 Tax=Sclerotinia borealis (strain F-4128) TaxID=1432307 RepID=W9C5J3_SCLBF|nr:aldehyde dehydrogenase [Sclerotinia borealis F-4128]
MSTNTRPPNTSHSHSHSHPPEKSYFEQQRGILLGEIAIVGNEFSSVEALWSQFENVMAKDESSPHPSDDMQVPAPAQTQTQTQAPETEASPSKPGRREVYEGEEEEETIMGHDARF